MSPCFCLPVVNSSISIDISQLRIGMYVQLDGGWMSHPFPVSSFRVASEDQLVILRGLGLTEVRYVPEKSDPDLHEAVPAATSASERLSPDQGAQDAPPDGDGATGPDAATQLRRAQLALQNRTLAGCNQRFGAATLQFQALARSVLGCPGLARTQGDALVSGCVTELLANGESVIRLLSEGVGEHQAVHPVNVMVASLLLGKALGMQSAELHDLGVAALLHDLGKLRLPAQVAQAMPTLTPIERAWYESHVGESVNFARRMGQPDAVVTAIAQHHEMADGSGFPLRLRGGDIERASQILALANHYDRMCNPVIEVDQYTPHEVLAVLFAQRKARFDAVVLGAFIRMMGVYPPGSVVQLVNDRYALVVSVNSSRPLCPRVIVHDPLVPKDEAPILDLETVPELGIRRSLKPAQLPRAVLDYLSPRQRICYFFERAVDSDSQEVVL